ncbi:unnamed protein product [Ilex paraguariensis]|uniref:Uncharacterized protein n=1 Tax=Ilex paraguariensis TaxID=185542 RepID=A0ABC8UTG5_9AQUA
MAASFHAAGCNLFIPPTVSTGSVSMKMDANLKEPMDTVGGMNKMQPVARKEAAMERTRSSHHKAWKKNITLLIFTDSRQVFEE